MFSSLARCPQTGQRMRARIVVAELHFEHDPKNGRAVQQEDHQVGAIFRGLDVREIGGVDAHLSVIGKRHVQCIA